MKSFVIAVTSILLLLLCMCKKKDPDPNAAQASTTTTTGGTTGSYPSCQLNYTVHADTNYIPFANNNAYYYCFTNITQIKPKYVLIQNYQHIGNSIYFDFVLSFPNQIAQQIVTIPYPTKIDSLGKYHMKFSTNDTITIIDPMASNGDTIYKKNNSYVVLISKDSTYHGTSHCYFTRSSIPSDGFSNGSPYYSCYRRGVGVMFSAQVNTLITNP
jgi:hypothetical protein